MLKALLESLDEKVFTQEVKQTLEETFNEAVELKAKEIADDRIEEEIEKLSEKSDEYQETLMSKAEEYIQLKETEMAEVLDQYLDRIVEEFVTSKEEALDEAVKSEKADLLIEAFESFIISAGVDVARIAEAKEDTSTETKLQESVSKQDDLVEEILALKAENDKLIKLGIISELTEGLTLVEAEKFKRLAELVDFEKSEKYHSKLETIKESVIGSKVKEELTENDKEKPVYTASYAHLI